MATRLDKLIEAAEQKNDVFNLKELFKDAGIRKSQKSEDEIYDYLLASGYLYFDEEELFIPQTAYLPYIPIRIQLTPQELSGQFLVLGHRVIPFFRDDLEITDLKIFYQGMELSAKERVFKMENFSMFITLLDGELFPVKNMDEMLSDSFKPRVDVLDISKIIKDNKLTINDNLILESIDFKKGHFEIKVEKEKEQKEKHFQIRANSNLLLECIEGTINDDFDLNQEETVFGTLLCAYYIYYQRLNKKFADVAPMALGPLLRTQDEFVFSRLPDGSVVFHNIDEEPENPSMDWNELMEDALERVMSEEDYDLTTIDGILMSVGNTHNQDEVKAIILDQLAFDSYSFPKLLEYLFEGRSKPYLPEELEKELKKQVDKEHRKLAKNFNRKKHTLPINYGRRKVLDILKEISLMLRKLDHNYVDVTELPGDLMEYLMHIQEMLSITLKALEDPNDKEECSKILANLDKAEEVTHRVIQEILAHFDLA